MPWSNRNESQAEEETSVFRSLYGNLPDNQLLWVIVFHLIKIQREDQEPRCPQPEIKSWDTKFRCNEGDFQFKVLHLYNKQKLTRRKTVRSFWPWDSCVKVISALQMHNTVKWENQLTWNWKTSIVFRRQQTQASFTLTCQFKQISQLIYFACFASG